MKQSNYALRLQPALKLEAEKIARAEGTTLNQLINVALAEKLAAFRTIDYLRERGKRGNVARALEILHRAGTDEPPREGDEV